MRYILLLIGVIITAGIFFAFQKEWLIMQWPYTQQPIAIPQQEHKECTLFWPQHHMLQETKTIVWTHDTAHNLHVLIKSWLTYLYEEELHKRIRVETVMLNSHGTQAFISFDRYPFFKQQSIQEKIQFVEHLLQTIAQCTDIEQVRLLVRHEPLKDHHLDFDQSWNV